MQFGARIGARAPGGGAASSVRSGAGLPVVGLYSRSLRGGLSSMAEQRFVEPPVEGSSPSGHPKSPSVPHAPRRSARGSRAGLYARQVRRPVQGPYARPVGASETEPARGPHFAPIRAHTITWWAVSSETDAPHALAPSRRAYERTAAMTPRGGLHPCVAVSPRLRCGDPEQLSYGARPRPSRRLDAWAREGPPGAEVAPWRP